MKRTLAFLGFCTRSAPSNELGGMPVPFTATSDTSASCDAFSTKKIVGVQGPKAPLQTWRFFFGEIICEIGLRSYSPVVRQKSSDRNQEPAELRWHNIQVFRGLFWKPSHVPMGHLLFMDCLLAFKSAQHHPPGSQLKAIGRAITRSNTSA